MVYVLCYLFQSTSEKDWDLHYRHCQPVRHLSFARMVRACTLLFQVLRYSLGKPESFSGPTKIGIERKFWSW